MQCSKPWEIVCADFVGPLPRSSKGHTCLLVLLDKFSRWVELIPVRQATAGCVVTALKERIIYRFGCPKTFLTDNGRQFVSKEVEKFLSDHGINHKLTASYAPHENLTERTNRIVKTMIAQHSEINHRHWDQVLPEIAFAINTAVREPKQGLKQCSALTFTAPNEIFAFLWRASNFCLAYTVNNLKTKQFYTLKFMLTFFFNLKNSISQYTQ